MKKASRENRVLKTTFPIIKSILLQNKSYLIWFILISFLLGVVPVMKSELESGLISVTNDIMESNGRDVQLTTGEIGDYKIQRFYRSEVDDEDDWVTQLIYFLFNDINIWGGLIYYTIIASITYAIRYRSKVILSTLRISMFTALRTSGLKKCLQYDTHELPSHENIAGNQATSIHYGSNIISNTYEYLIQVAQNLFSLATILILVLSKSYIFGLACILLASIQALISYQQARRLKAKRNEFDHERNEILAKTDEVLSKRELLLAYEQQDRYTAKILTNTKKYGAIDRLLEIKEALFREISNFFMDLGRIIVLAIALILIFAFDINSFSDIGDAYFMISIYFRIFAPISNILNKYDNFKKSEDTASAFLDILEFNSERKIEKSKATQDPSHGITFSNVDFSYKEGKSILKNTSFQIPQGKTTLILGPSGCGKSTIAKILLGFQEIDSGKILIEGSPIQHFTSDELRLKMSYVAQNVFIIEDTIKENLEWGIKNFTGHSDEKLLDTIQSLGINPTLDSTFLEKSSIKLSIGQQQRISLARMLLDDAEIAILDEPLSGVDIFQTSQIIPYLQTEFDKSTKTVILISHDLSFVSCADHVIILDTNGEVNEEGKPRELLKNNGQFAMLLKLAKEELTVK